MSQKTGPVILVYDIEILQRPEDLVLNSFRAYPGYSMGANISSIISFGYKEFGAKGKAKCLNTWDYNPEEPLNDEELCKKIYEVLKDVDYVITYYGKKFDEKFVRARLMKYGMQLPKVTHIDMHAIVKRNFKFSSNRLKEVLKFFGLENKMDTGGWELWMEVLRKNAKAYAKMSKYCAQDVDVLERLVKHLDNYVPLPGKTTGCPKCESESLIKNGTSYRSGGSVQKYLCRDCGHVFRGARIKGTEFRSIY